MRDKSHNPVSVWLHIGWWRYGALGRALLPTFINHHGIVPICIWGEHPIAPGPLIYLHWL
jgi:hypothetical protein